MTPQAIFCVLPELILVAVATLVYVAGALLGPRRNWTWLAVGGLALAGGALWEQYHSLHSSGGAAQPLAAVALGGPVAADLFGQYVRWLALLMGLMFVLVSSRPAAGVQAPEFLGTLLMAVAGVMLVGAARELVLLFVGLELVSIPTYVLLYLGRRDEASQEAAAKYFFLSILSSAVLLYGFSFLYGLAGSTELARIAEALGSEAKAAAGLGALAPVALVLIVSGLAFRLAAVPFHFYAPDVYQGTTNGNAGFLAVMPKIVGLTALVRVAAVAMPGLERYGWGVAIILALLTMTLGNVLALWQDNIRRLLAYSSIAHGGYMLIGLAVGWAASSGAGGETPLDGIGAALLYLAVYGLATTGTFAALVYLGSPQREIDGVEELAGLGRTHPWTAIVLAVFMFSLAGIPPLAGFWGKLALFFSALDIGTAEGVPRALANWFLGLSIAGALNAAIAAAYYLRIIGVMYFRAPVAAPKAQGGRGAAVAALACAALVLVVGFYPRPLERGSVAAAEAARAVPVAPATVALAPAQTAAQRGQAPRHDR